MPLVLQVVAGEFAACRLPRHRAGRGSHSLGRRLFPAWSGSAVFSSVTRSADEPSIILVTAGHLVIGV